MQNYLNLADLKCLSEVDLQVLVGSEIITKICSADDPPTPGLFLTLSCQDLRQDWSWASFWWRSKERHLCTVFRALYYDDCHSRVQLFIDSTLSSLTAQEDAVMLICC